MIPLIFGGRKCSILSWPASVSLSKAGDASMGHVTPETGKFVEFKRFSKKFKRDDFMKVAVIQMSPVFLDKSAMGDTQVDDSRSEKKVQVSSL